MTKQDSIEQALRGLRARGINYLDVLAYIAGEGRDTGSFLVLIRTEPGSYTVYAQGKGTTSHDILSLVKTFKDAAMRTDGMTEEPETIPGDQGVPCDFDQTEKELVADEFAEKLERLLEAK